MSPRAASRLERLGYNVYDYSGGKVDWIAAALPSEGRPHPPRVLEAVDGDPPRCAPTDRADVVVARLAARTSDACVVVDEHDVVLGRLRRDHVLADDDRSAEDVMEPGPETVRAHDDLRDTRRRMSRRHVGSLLVTTPQGVLLGELRADSTTAR
jgi:hypothetical protein